MTILSNPLLDFSSLPRFSEIQTEQITPAIEALLNESKTILDTIRHDQQPPTWSTFVQPIVDATERLSRAWGQVSHLNAVMNSPELRAVYNKNLPLITQFYAELSQDQQLFEKFRQLRATQEYATLNPVRRKIIENELRDFRLGGAELPGEQKQRFLKIQEALSETSSQFNDNLLDATNAFSLLITNPQDVAGIPEDALHTARQLAEQEGKDGWKFTLHMPSYLPAQQYADHRELREKMYRAYNTRASEFDASHQKDGQSEAKNLDNMPLINRILELREEEARLLGFNNYAEVSLATKMAASPQQVLDFLRELAAKAKPYAEKDLQELQQFAAEQLNLPTLESWDIPYVSEKLRQARYAFSDQEVKQYFPEDKVLPGMFRLVEKLYRITIAPADTARNVQYWHPDVRLYDIFDASGTLIGQFYIDLYARASKRGGAWMDSAISRRLIKQEHGAPAVQIPVAYLTCNFSAPVAVNSQSRPALFTHDEVIVLFHEFGHGLHHLLTQVDDLSVSGISGVEWDAVELPSQFMENFCWEWNVLTGMTGHIETGEPLPRALYEKMLAAKNFQSGMQMVRQIEFALFDMRLHSDFNPHGSKTVLQLLDEVRNEVAVIFPPAYHRFPNNFAHIFGGGYAAGYYSYKWAEVLSADAYGLFEEQATSAEGVLNTVIGTRFRKEILAVGGSRPALESFTAFRGRAPQMDALLRHNGMAA